MAMRDEFEDSGAWMFRWRSYLPLLFLVLLIIPLMNFEYIGGSHALDEYWDAMCIAVSMLGLLVRAITVGYTPAGTSGRNTHGQVAESLNTTGIYSLVRHPLYLGNFLMWFGVVIFPHDVYLALLVTTGFFLYYERIMFAEEAYLRAKFGQPFEAWAQRTPAFFPRPYGWVSPGVPFSIRNVLKREYSGFFALVILFTACEVLGDLAATGQLMIEPGWAVFFLVGTLIYLVLRTLKKHTRLLHVEGR